MMLEMASENSSKEIHSSEALLLPSSMSSWSSSCWLLELLEEEGGVRL